MLKAVCKFCSYLFWPQKTDKSRYDDLKKSITTLIGQEISEGRTDTLSSEYISHMLKAPLTDVEKIMKEMNE